MLQKGFLKTKTTRIPKDNNLFSWVNKATLFIGISILIAALVYMIINLDRADAIVKIWLPFMAAGVFMVFISQFPHILK